MSRQLALADHFSSDELLERFRREKGRVARAHWQVLYLKSLGWPTVDIAQAAGYHREHVRRFIRRYNREGEQAVIDQRPGRTGSKPMLEKALQAELTRALEAGRAPDGGAWTGPKVARWIEEKTGRPHVHDQRGWDYLIRLGFSAQRPRPRHQGASREKQEAFKKHAPRVGAAAPGG